MRLSQVWSVLTKVFALPPKAYLQAGAFYGTAAVLGLELGIYIGGSREGPFYTAAKGWLCVPEKQALATLLGTQPRYEPVLGKENLVTQTAAALRTNNLIVVVPSDAVSDHYRMSVHALRDLYSEEARSVVYVSYGYPAGDAADGPCDNAVPDYRFDYRRDGCHQVPQLNIESRLAAVKGPEPPRALVDIVIYHAGACDRDFIERTLANYDTCGGKVRLSFVFAKPCRSESTELGGLTSCTVVRHATDAASPQERRAWDGWLRWYVQCRAPSLDADAAIEVLGYYAAGDGDAVRAAATQPFNRRWVASVCQTRRLLLARLSSLVQERFQKRAEYVYGGCSTKDHAIGAARKSLAALGTVPPKTADSVPYFLYDIGAVNTLHQLTVPMWRLLVDPQHPNRLQC